MAQLFDRDLILTVGNTEIRMREPGTNEPRPTLRVQFEVVKTLRKTPNEAKVAIYNLALQTRQALQEKDVPCRIVCGYVQADEVTTGIHQIFLGSLDYSRSTLQGTDWITTLQSSDGGREFRTARINTSLRGPVKVTDALRQASEALGLSLGNLQEKIQQGGIRAAFNELQNGIVLSGKAEQQVDKLVRSLGYEWSSQDGELLLLGTNETISGATARVLSAQTGLIGTPEPGEEGRVKARALILPDLGPGNRVKVESRQIDGFYKIDSTTYRGDTWGQDWYCDLELRPLG